MRELHRLAATLALEAGMSKGELLRMAREVSHNGSLVSLDLLTAGQLRELIGNLERARFAPSACSLVAALMSA